MGEVPIVTTKRRIKAKPKGLAPTDLVYTPTGVVPAWMVTTEQTKRRIKPKPRGERYRNLHARGGSIYYEAVVGGVRRCVSLKTADWKLAAERAVEHRQAHGTGRAAKAEVPLFDAFAAKYLEEATTGLAGTTREDRRKLLRPAEGERPPGIVTQAFSGMRLDAITRPVLLSWWQTEVEAKGRSQSTGMNYLSALSGVLGYATDLELLSENPVDAFRFTLRRRRRTKQGRAEATRGRHKHPLESAKALAAFVRASEEIGATRRVESKRPILKHQHGHVADLLQLDAGLRIGEVAGLRWRDIVWGTDPNDTTRALMIRESLARGKHEGPPKSGRGRKVALSRRLRAILRDFWVACGQPAPGERVLPRFNPRNYAQRHFKLVCERAGLERHTPKDLRSSFVSWLLTCGVQLAYVSEQAGHGDVSVTGAHYGKWAEGNAYRLSLRVRDGEVPADLIARLCEDEESHQTPITEVLAGDPAEGNSSDKSEAVR
jgi:integrase